MREPGNRRDRNLAIVRDDETRAEPESDGDLSQTKQTLICFGRVSTFHLVGLVSMVTCWSAQNRT